MAILYVPRTGPIVRSSAAATATGVNPCVVTKPTVANGDLLIAIQTQINTGTSAAMVAPTGWVQRGATGGSGTVGWMKIWWKVAQEEGSTWSFAKDADGVVSVLVIRNWDNRTDFTWHFEPTFQTGSASTTHTSPSITLTNPVALQIRAFASNSGGTTHSTASGMTENQDNTVAASNGHSVCTVQSAGAGSTGTLATTSSGSQPFVCVSIAIAAAENTASALYSPSATLPYWSTADNTLFCVIGANSTGADGDADCMVSSVIDDAHNVWVPAVTKFQAATDANTAVRAAIWYCAGAKAIKQITVTMSKTCDSLGFEVLEFSGVTNVSPADGVGNTGGSAATTTQNATFTTVNATDVVVAVGVNGDSTSTLGNTVGTFTATGLTSPAVASGFVTDSQVDTDDDTALKTCYKITSSGAAQTTTFTNSASASMAWCVFALKAGAVVATNPNPRWPSMAHGLGLGSDPNDPSDTIVYTAITNKVTSFACQRGRSYELARTEAGEADVRLNNYDGRFDPTNVAGTYYPNIKVLTPYRCQAVWNGITYNIFTGYVERWPQKWDDGRGTSRMLAVDGLSTLAGTRLSGAIGQEIKDDQPHAYWPLDDGRLADQAKNVATVSSTPLTVMTSIDGGGTASFGASMVLQSEESTCWDQSISSNVTQTTNAPFGKNLSAVMTLPQLSNGIVIECWAKIPPTSLASNYTLMAVKSTAFTSNAQRRVALIQIDSNSGLVNLYTSDSGGALTATSSSRSGLNDTTWHHYVMHLTTTTARVWIDGTEVINYAWLSVPASTIDMVNFGGEADGYQPTGQGNIAVGQFAHAAVFQLATVDTRRIAARANAGLTGFPEKSGARISRILRYGGWAGPQAIDDGLSFLGATATIPRQTLLSASQDVSSWENGLSFVDGSGNFRFMGRDTRFNQNIKYIFGGKPGEIPYETDVEIDYDPKYVFNDVTVTRVLSNTPATGSTLTTGSSSSHVIDQPSIFSYFTRSLDKQTGVASIAQCQAEADWIIKNYAQPRARLARISITPSGNPTLWPIALGIEIGDRVLVRRQPFGGADIELDCYVEQVAHQVRPEEWQTVLTLSPVLLTTYGGQSDWILDASTLNVDTTVGSP